MPTSFASTITNGHPVISLANPVAFLWRCESYAASEPDHKDRAEVAEFARKNFPNSAMHFTICTH